MTAPVALVTGATAGIGAATAVMLHDRGWTVYAAGRRLQRLEDLAQRGPIPLQLDVTDDASMTACVTRILHEQGRIDALVNNAGYGALGAVEDTDAADARQQFDVNLFGPARLIQLVLPAMRQQHSGRIVNVSSVGGKIYSPLGGWYHATKHALEGLSDSLRLELAPHGIDVVIVEPGATRTEWGPIAADHVERTSGSGPYAADARLIASTLRSSARRARNAAPDVVAEAIVTACITARPRTRYVVGTGAVPAVVLRRLLTDRGFDRLARRVMREPRTRG